MTAPGQVVAVKPDEGGGIGSWDVRAVRHALTSVMRRRPEAYHDTLRRGRHRRGRAAGSRRGRRVHPRPHQGQRAGHLEAALVRRLRATLGAGPHPAARTRRPSAFEQAAFAELGDFVSGRIHGARDRHGPRSSSSATAALTRGRGTRSPLRVRKTLTFGSDRRVPTLDLAVEVTNRASRPVEALLGVEWALNMLGGGGNPSAWYAVDGDRGRFDAARVAPVAHHVGMGNTLDRHRARVAAAAGGRGVVVVDRDDLGLGERLRGQPPGRLPALGLAAPAGAWRDAIGEPARCSSAPSPTAPRTRACNARLRRALDGPPCISSDGVCGGAGKVLGTA